MAQKYFTVNMPLLTPNHSYEKRGGPEAFTSITICKKCGIKTSSGMQERYIVKTHWELQYLGERRLPITVYLVVIHT